MTLPLVQARDVSRHFTRKLDYAERMARLLGSNIEESVVRAVNNVDMAVAPGEILGLVGESGCGKSTLGEIMAGITPPSDGVVEWNGKPIADLSKGDLQEMRLSIQLIFQDPMSSLNPRKRVIDLIGEAPVVHGLILPSEMDDYVSQLMSRVGLDPGYRHRYAHQFSGGQRQRIGIARALAVKPRMLVCDESVASLDVSLQAQVINLFLDLRDELGLAFLFISHDLSVVKHISDRVAVMYLGRIVETAAADQFFAAPNHQYSAGLLRQLPSIGNRSQGFSPIYGEIPSPLHPPTGCTFHPRCPKAFESCNSQIPALLPVGPGHFSACHLNTPAAINN
jgi:peptide/nickel transport system ATP-binding protein